MQSFFAGTLTLTAALGLARLLGVVPKVVLPRTVGLDVVGLYQMSYPTLVFFSAVSRFGMNVAVAKRVAEAKALGRTADIRRILRVALAFALGVSLPLSALLVMIAPTLAESFYLDTRLVWPLWGIAPAVPLIAVANVFRAYFQGLGDMRPTAVCAIVETGVRVGAALVLSAALFPYGEAVAATGLTLGIAAGELMGLFAIVALFYRGDRRTTARARSDRETPVEDARGTHDVFRDLWRIAYPVGLTGIVGTLAYALEPSVVAHSFKAAGLTREAASAAYGMLSGLAVFVLYFPTTFTYSLSVTLIPAVSAYKAQKKTEGVIRRLHQSSRATALIAFPSAAGVFFFAEPLSTALFGTPEVAPILKTLAPFAPFLYWQGPLGAALQGLDRVRIGFIHTLVGSAVKLALIAVLARRPELGVLGVAWALNASLALVTSLHALRLHGEIGWSPRPSDVVPALISATTAFFASRVFVYVPLSAVVASGTAFAAAGIIGTAVYAVLLFVSGGITRRDLLRLWTLKPR